MSNPSPTPENSLVEIIPAPKKKWGKYLLEFLMIFLAVFLGFIAENMREHFGEQQQAKEYAQALYNDLKKDSAGLGYAIGFKTWRNAKLDSLAILMDYPDHQRVARELYHYSCYATMIDFVYKPADVTIQQLRNTGSLRYFNIQLYSAITRYYNDYNFYMERENENRQFVPPLALISKIFDADQMMLMFSNGFVPDRKNVIIWPTKDVAFRMVNSYEQSWNEFSMLVGRQRQRCLVPVVLLNDLVKKDLTELMAALRNEYQVK